MKTVILLCLFFAPLAHAQYNVRDVGLIGLMSHDIFAWDHKKELNTENGRLDLSTIFDYEGGSRWRVGGNPKNSENSPVYSVVMNLVDHYQIQLAKGMRPLEARRETVAHFHEMLKEFYERALQEEFPQNALREIANNVEQASLRGFHDVLPGRIRMYDRPFWNEMKLTDFLTAKTRLNEKELSQPLKPFDGDYDPEYKKIKIPFSKVVLNLMEIDRKFIEKFSSFKQADMLRELAEVGRGERTVHEVSFAPNVKVLFRKAFCSEGSDVMPEMACE